MLAATQQKSKRKRVDVVLQLQTDLRLRLRPAGPETGAKQRDVWQLERYAERAAVPPQHAAGSHAAIAALRPSRHPEPRLGLQLRR